MKFAVKYNRVDQRTFEFSESDVERILIAEAKKAMYYRLPPAGVKATWTMDICEGSWDEDTDKRVEPVITLIERFEHPDAQPQSVDAVDPSATSTGKLTPRV